MGKSFENLMKNVLESFGLQVFQNIKKYSFNGKIIQLNSNGGEIDLIAFDLKRKICYFLECKMLNFSTEPRYYLEDYNKFFEKKKGYYYKFNKKIDFFIKNQKEIINYLIERYNINFSIEYKFITFYLVYVNMY